MNIINSRRLRFTVRRFNPGYGERFKWWSFQTYRSRDHGRPRSESNVSGSLAGVIWHFKWRPDGRTGDGCAVNGEVTRG